MYVYRLVDNSDPNNVHYLSSYSAAETTAEILGLTDYTIEPIAVDTDLDRYKQVVTKFAVLDWRVTVCLVGQDFLSDEVQLSRVLSELVNEAWSEDLSQAAHVELYRCGTVDQDERLSLVIVKHRN